MNALSRIPLWFWWVFSTIFSFAMFNATDYHFVALMESGLRWEVKAMVSIIVLIVASLYLIEGSKTWNAWGLMLFAAFFGLLLYVAFKGDMMPSIYWWGPVVSGFFLTLSLQGNRVYRSLTGRVPTSPDVHHDHDAHHA